MQLCALVLQVDGVSELCVQNALQPRHLLHDGVPLAVQALNLGARLLRRCGRWGIGTHVSSCIVARRACRAAARLTAAASRRRRSAPSQSCRPPRSAPARRRRAQSARARTEAGRACSLAACLRVVCDHDLVGRVLEVIQQLLRARGAAARRSARGKATQQTRASRRAFFPSSSASSSCSRLLRRPKELMLAWSSRVTSGVSLCVAAQTRADSVRVAPPWMHPARTSAARFARSGVAALWHVRRGCGNAAGSRL